MPENDDYNDDVYWANIDAEQEYADRWVEAWDRLEALGVVSHPEHSDITLGELERIAGYVKS